MLKRVLVIVVVSAALTMAQQIVFSSLPKNLQLFGRDAQDSAVVTIAGTVVPLDSDSVSVALFKDGVLSKRVSYSLSGNSAFSVSFKIHAELASYKIEIRLDSKLITSVDKIVCGDAFLVDGQSNAAGSGQTYVSPWVRTFNLDSTWVNSEYSNCPWGIGRHIIEDYKIPVCFINGAVGGTAIELHQRDTTLSSIYGKIYWRIIRAGLRNHIRGVIWHQGETHYDSSGQVYLDLFRAMYNGWKADFPGIERVFVFQTHSGCVGGWLDAIREAQRRMPSLFPDISVISTSGVVGHDGCHFTSAGYLQMGDWMYRLIARDLYRSADTLNITSPDIRAVWFDATRTRLTLQFDQPVLLPSDLSLKDKFLLDDKGSVADSLLADTAQHTITLVMPNASSASSVTYVPNKYPGTNTIYEGPWLFNTRGVGALTFYKFPIRSDSLLFVDTSFLDFYASGSTLLPVDPVVCLANSGYPVSPLTAIPDSAWLHVMVSGTGNSQVLHHSINTSALESGKTYTTKVHLSAQGRKELIYTVRVKMALPIPTSLWMVNDTLRLYANDQVLCKAMVLDQFNTPYPGGMKIGWSVSGGGVVDETGKFISNGEVGRFVVLASTVSTPSLTAQGVLSVVDGLVIHWNLDDSAGVTVKNWADSANPGLLNGGGVWNVSGKSGGSLELDTNTFVVAAQQIKVPINYAVVPLVFTEALWFKTLSNTYGRLMGYGSSKTGISPDNNYSICMDSTGKIVFSLYSGSTTTLSSTSSLNDGKWHHVAAMLSGGGLKLYIDGVLDASQTYPTVAYMFNGYWRIGRDRSRFSSPRALAAQIDDARVYGRALTAAEISRLFSGGAASDLSQQAIPKPLMPLLSCAKPNPFGVFTIIGFAVPASPDGAQAVRVSIKIYDLRGRLIKTLINGKIEAGYHSVRFSNTDQEAPLVNGIYFCRMQTANYQKMVKLVVAR